VAGVSTLDEKPTVGGQLGKGAIGAVLGAAGEVVGAGIQKGLRDFRQWKSSTVSPTTKVAWQKADVRQNAAEKLRRLKTNNTNAQKVIVDNIKQLDDELTQASQTGAIDIQERLPKFFRANSESYGQRLNSISDDLVSKGNEMWVGEADDILSRTLKEADELGLPNSGTREAISNLYNKYRIDPTKTNYADNPVNFKEFNSDLRKVFSSVYSKGKPKFTDTDVVVNILKKNYGDYVAERVPEFAELQQAYKPIVQGMKEI
jgi:hypothetical protein